MVEGQEELCRWEEMVHFFLSEDPEIAFQRALQRGHQGELRYQEGRHRVEIQLAEIVRLNRLGSDRRKFEVSLVSKSQLSTWPSNLFLIQGGVPAAHVLKMCWLTPAAAPP